jgi:hypothetical protein
MAGFGYGFGRLGRRRGGRDNVMAIAKVRPSAGWSGTAGSGFAAGSAPADPVRTTAKPAMRLVVPSDQYFASGLVVGVIAGANDNGSLLQTMGLSGVVVHYEGTSVTVKAPTYRSYRDANGVKRMCFGWWAQLVHDGRIGDAQVYFEAIPRDPAMQRRVLGPYLFYPSAQEFDRSVTVEPGQPVLAGSRYPSVGQALAYLASVGANNPLVTIRGGGTIDIGQGPATTYQGKGYCTIAAETPVTIAKANFTTDAAALLRTRYDGLRFKGSNITFDARYISNIYQENASGRQHWLDGVRVIHSGGRDELWRGSSRKLSSFVRNGAWLTEIESDGVANIANGARLARGCLFRNGYQDVVTDAACVVHTRTEDWDSSFWLTENPSFSVTFTGAEATATLELAGANEASTRTFTARWGANSASFSVGTSEAMQASGNYLASHVVNWLNSLGVGFIASVLDDRRRAAACSLAGLKGAGFSAQNVKNATLQIVTMFDVHGDWHQQNNGQITENCVLANNLATGLVAQNIFLTGTGGARDFLVFNNAFDNKKLTGIYNNFASIGSQLAFAKSHVVVAHNSLAVQSFGLRGDQGLTLDQWCLIANNSFRDLAWSGTQANTALVRNNHLQAGAVGGTIGTGSFIGGTSEQVFRDSGGGSFTARSVLYSNSRVPVVPMDRNGNVRTMTDICGSETREAIPDLAPAGSTAGSLQFPPFNRQYAGRGGHVAYPSTGLTSQPLLKFDTPGAFFIMIQVPHERTKLNREARIFGNAVGTGGQTFSLVHHGDDYFDTTRHDEFRWRARGSSGDQIDLSVDVQTRGSRWQLLVVSCNGSGGYAMASYSPWSAKISGSTQTSTTAQINGLTGTHVLLGDVASAGGTLEVLASPVGAFDGAVAFHGFVHGTAGNDASWQAIAEGADIATTLSGATGFRLLRDYRGKSDVVSAIAPVVPGDATAAGSVFGTVSIGATSTHQPTKYLHFDRLPDGYVICPKDGENTGSVALSGVSGGLNGALYARVLSPAGATLVPPFVVDGTGPTMTVNVSLPPFAGWGHLELWSESDPSVVYRMNSRIGCGHKLSVIGQSQCDIMLYASGVAQTPSGLASFCGYVGSRSDPADTTTSPVKRFNIVGRPQLFVIEPEMGSVYNGVTAIASRIEPFGNGRALCVIDTCIPGTSALDWIRDSTTTRQWALDVEVAALAGTDRVPIWQWYTADAASYPALLDGVVLGTGSLAGNYRLFDGTVNAPGYRLGICLPTRATTTNAGPLSADDFGTNRSGAQTGQLLWAAANPTLCVVGPAVTDMAIDNLATGTTMGPDANLGGPHESQVLPEGVVRLGRRIGETYLRARGLSPSPSNARLDKATVVMAPGRTSLTIKAVLPNGGGLRTQDGRAVTGFEFSTNGGTSWSRSGINATITAPDTVTLSLQGGPWPAGARVSYLRGGPFSYGTAEELNAHYKGSLYDGCEADGGLGFPVLELPVSDALVV